MRWPFNIFKKKQPDPPDQQECCASVAKGRILIFKKEPLPDGRFKKTCRVCGKVTIVNGE